MAASGRSSSALAAPAARPGGSIAAASCAFGQQHVGAVAQPQVPAPLADADQRLGALAAPRHAPPAGRPAGAAPCSAPAPTTSGSAAEGADILASRPPALAVDHREAAVALPDGEGRALLDARRGWCRAGGARHARARPRRCVSSRSRASCGEKPSDRVAAAHRRAPAAHQSRRRVAAAFQHDLLHREPGPGADAGDAVAEGGEPAAARPSSSAPRRDTAEITPYARPPSAPAPSRAKAGRAAPGRGGGAARAAAGDGRCGVAPRGRSGVRRKVLRAMAGLLHHPGAELGEGDAAMRGLFRHQRGAGHAGLGVDLQQHQAAGLARGVVVAEIGARDAAAAERAVRRDARPPSPRAAASGWIGAGRVWRLPPSAYFAS